MRRRGDLVVLVGSCCVFFVMRAPFLLVVMVFWLYAVVVISYAGSYTYVQLVLYIM